MLRSLMETMVVDKAFIARISERPECAFNVQEVTLLYIRLFQEGMDSNFISLTTFIRLCGPKFVTKRLFVLMLEDAKALQIVQPKSSDPVVAGDCVSFEFFVCFVSFFSPNVPVEEKLKKSFRTFTLTNPEYISPADLQRFLKESLTDNRLVVPDYVLAAVVANTFRNAGVCELPSIDVFFFVSLCIRFESLFPLHTPSNLLTQQMSKWTSKHSGGSCSSTRASSSV
eukprot:c12665_g2_i2.p1 GENE.c12665_g2_i2~~c12665_g2_i2.p1  ORF type:complete len:227 (+),score=48.67 c12665_g2_i2:159-839(+)